ncbi:MAG: tripartite tricarboxylate transporter substrate binding protein [Burkholderiales bacterium]|nr:tripartite tricarboxylate transporter substrate binding protein [Burkholderiales bacterium]
MKTAIVLAALTACALTAFEAASQAYPSKPVTIIVPQAPGGANDVLSRLVAGKLGEYWGQPVLVDFKPGGGAVVATQYVARSAPDGSVVGLVTSAHATNLTLNPKLPYDTLKDFAPVARLGFNVIGLVVTPSLPVSDVKDLIELARRKPDALSHGSNGIGTGAHLAGELFKSMAGVKMIHVPYKGGAPLYTDMLGGRIPVAFAILNSAMPLVKAGKLRLLAVTNPQRSTVYPDYPPMSATLPGYDVTTWTGFVVAAGTPREIVNKIGADLIRVANAPELRPKFADLGYETAPLGPAEFDAFIRAEIESKGRLVRESGAKFE